MKYIKESEMRTKKKEQMKKRKILYAKEHCYKNEKEIDWFKKWKKLVNCKNVSLFPFCNTPLLTEMPPK